MSYRKTSLGKMIERLSDGAFIPKDELNMDYQEFLEWEKAGNVIQEAAPIERPAERVKTKAELQSELERLTAEIERLKD